MTDFHFLRPWWLLAVLPLAALIRALYRRQNGDGDWREFCDAALLPHILIGTSGPETRRPLWLAALAGALTVLALAGPAWERLPAPVFRNLSALVVVLDLSMAMDTADLKPSRLERARFRIEDLLRARKDGQTALLVYAGDAFTVTPLTDDAATISAQLAALSPRLMPVQGARADLGLEAAARLLKQAGLKAGDVLVISTGEGVTEAGGAVARLRSEGYRVSVLGVGTAEGGPVPLAEGGFLKDEQGNIVIPRLDETALKSLAESGGGLYRRLESGAGDLDALLRFFDRRADAAQQTGHAVQIEQWREAGVFLLPLLLPLAALAFRRGWLGIWLLFVLAPTPQRAEALEWQDLWLTPDQRAHREFRAGDSRAAAEHFRDPEWKAAAEYQAGQYQQAEQALEKLDTAASHYNRGNALARQGKLEHALQAYDRALQLSPGDADTQYNRKLVEEALRKRQEQQKQQNPQQGDGQDQSQPPQASQSGQDGKKPPPQQGKSGEQEQGGRQGDDPSATGRSPDQGRNGESSGKKPDESAEGSEAAEDRPAPDPAGQSTGTERNQAQAGALQESTAPGRPEPDAEPRPALSEAADETHQAEEQWLRRIPDDPGGLLKRKFYYQYQQRRQPSEREPW